MSVSIFPIVLYTAYYTTLHSTLHCLYYQQAYTENERLQPHEESIAAVGGRISHLPDFQEREEIYFKDLSRNTSE